MAEYKDRRGDDRGIKELFETKLEVLDARYSNLKLQSEKVESKIDKLTEALEQRMRKLESAYHGQENQKGLLVRVGEQESEIGRLKGTIFRSATGSPGIEDDVAMIKEQRRKREHQWALMGGLASGFAIWLLTKFGDSAWVAVSDKWKHEAPKITEAVPRRRVRRVTRVAAPKPEAWIPPEETPEQE